MHEQIASITEAEFDSLVALRRRLHQCPEIGFDVHQTAKIIAAELRQVGAKVKAGIGRTGIVGTIKGKAKGPARVVAIRSDMDALPVTEQTGLPFASKTPGKMHACGHDAHMTVAVGVARVLAQTAADWSGTVKLVFQPSEEEPPGGAIEMIADGCLRSPDVDAIFGYHVDPWIPTGKIGVIDGPMMASVDDFDITITGVSGHAARPHLGTDAITAAASVIANLQTAVSRTIDPIQPAVVTIGKLEAGTARNVLAGSATLNGTLRTLDDRWRAKLKKRIGEIARDTAKSLGCRAEVSFLPGYPVLSNIREINDHYRAAARTHLGKSGVVELTEPVMGSEDFAMFLQEVPGAMIRLGIRDKKAGSTYGWHHPKFTVDERAIGAGVKVVATAIRDCLSIDS